MARPFGGPEKETGKKRIPWFRTWKTGPARGFTHTCTGWKEISPMPDTGIPGPTRKYPEKTAVWNGKNWWRNFYPESCKKKKPPDLAGGLSKIGS
jgi:hypothetical protein